MLTILVVLGTAACKGGDGELDAAHQKLSDAKAKLGDANLYLIEVNTPTEEILQKTRTLYEGEEFEFRVPAQTLPDFFDLLFVRPMGDLLDVTQINANKAADEFSRLVRAEVARTKLTEDYSPLLEQLNKVILAFAATSPSDDETNHLSDLLETKQYEITSELSTNSEKNTPTLLPALSRDELENAVEALNDIISNVKIQVEDNVELVEIITRVRADTRDYFLQPLLVLVLSAAAEPDFVNESNSLDANGLASLLIKSHASYVKGNRTLLGDDVKALQDSLAEIIAEAETGLQGKAELESNGKPSPQVAFLNSVLLQCKTVHATIRQATGFRMV